MGTGAIAHRFAREVAPIAAIHAVASRNPANAEAYAHEHGAARTHPDFKSLLADSAVDAVYIATPSPQHRTHCLMAIEAGKPVLCEKPFTLDADQAREVAAAARAHGVFCMEAMWMRFNPLVRQVRAWLEAGRIGPAQALRMEIGFKQPPQPGNRILDPQRGGGALLDLGVYGLSLAEYLLGHAERAVAEAKFHPGGVDETTSALLSFPGALATLTCAIGTTPTNRAMLMGADGRIEMGPPFFNPEWIRLTPVTAVAPAGSRAVSRKRRLLRALPMADRLRHSAIADWLRRDDGETVYLPRGASALREQAAEVIRCVRAGRTESEIMPLDDSLAVMALMDRLRRDWPAPG